MKPRPYRWFYRRPCAWWAVAAVCAALATVEGGWGGLVWGGVGVAALAACGAGRREAGSLLALACLAGMWTLHAIQLPPGFELREGEPATVRGIVLATWDRPEGGPWCLVRVAQRLTPNGWKPAAGRLGLAAPGPVVSGAAVEASGTLARPRPARNPGSRSARLSWLRRGAYWTLELRPEGWTVLRPGAGSWLGRWATSVRERLLAWNRSTLAPGEASIANDFLVGDRDPPEPATGEAIRREFRDSGTIHLLVVSGTQVSPVLGLFVWLGWRFYRWRAALWGAGLVALGFYYLLTDGSASVVRAGVMGLVCLGALTFTREPDPENCLGLAALVLIALNPLTVYDPGAQLSFAAVWSLVRLRPALYRVLADHDTAVPDEGPVPGWTMARRQLARVLCPCVAAHLGTAPLVAYHFQRDTWASPLANLVMIPLAGVFMAAAVGHLGLGLLGWRLSAPVTGGVARSLLGWAGVFAAPGLGAAAVLPPPAWLAVACVLLLALTSALPPRLVPRAVWVTVAALLLLQGERVPAAPPASPTLRALDVGQGDAVLLQGPDGCNVLVDTGPPPDPGWEAEIGRVLRALRVRDLDALVLTHAHADHTGGAAAVLDTLPVGLVLYGPGGEDTPEWRSVVHAATAHRVPLHPVLTGERLCFRESVLTVLSAGPAPGAARGDLNESSVVFRWDSAGARFLLTGDAGAPTEERLLSWGRQLRADVLKVGHHGSRMASSQAFLDAVGARAAILSCGLRNPFGHPAPETLARLAEAGMPVYRTDRGGMLTVEVLAGQVRVRPYVAE